TTVYAAGSTSLLRSTNGGSTWTNIAANTPGPHADHHGGTFNLLGHYLDACDGGLFSYDGISNTWASINGTPSSARSSGALNTNQFIGVALSATNANIAFGGTQDNGTLRFSDSLGWTKSEGGDGGTVL